MTTVSDPAIGIWKLNPTKSSFVLAPAPRSSVVKVEPWEDGLKVSEDSTDAYGNKIHPESACKLDGKDYQLTGSTIADSISATRINERQGKSVWKKGGKAVLTAKAVVSRDGKTLSVMTTSMNAQGRMVDEVMVYEKQ
jgi:hypothetical protein